MKGKNDGFWVVLLVLTILVSSILYDYYENPKNSQTPVVSVK